MARWRSPTGTAIWPIWANPKLAGAEPLMRDALLNLSGPQPTEGARRQERVDQPVHRRLERGEPGATVPDRHLPEGHRVCDECGGADEPEDAKVFRADWQGAPRDVGGQEADDRGIQEPLREIRPHRRRAAGQHREHHDRALPPLFEELRRAHVLGAGRAGDHVVARRDGERAERLHHLVFVRHLGVVALVPGQGHVDDRAHEEDDHRRQQDGEPQGVQRYHDDLLLPRPAECRKTVLAKELFRLLIPMPRGHDVHTGGSATARVVADGDPSNRHPTDRSSAQGQASDGATPDRAEDAERQAAKAEEAGREAPEGDHTPRESTDGKEPGGDVPDRDDAPGMAAQLTTSEIRSDRDVVERDIPDAPRGAPTDATDGQGGAALERSDMPLQFGHAFLEVLAAFHGGSPDQVDSEAASASGQGRSALSPSPRYRPVSSTE